MYCIDSDLKNADWTKQSWSIPANSVDELKRFLRSQDMTVAHFKTLPVYRWNVEKLEWLKEL